MAIESIGSSGIAQFQPRPQQSNFGTDNRAVLEQDNARSSAQASEQPAAQQAAQPQIPNAVTQPQPSNASERPGTAAAPTFQEFVSQQNEGPQRGERPEAGQNNNSALNYTASGAPNAANNPGQAGRLVSLSV